MKPKNEETIEDTQVEPEVVVESKPEPQEFLGPPNLQAPQGWRPGVKFYSRYGRFTLMLRPSEVTIINGQTMRKPARIIEFFDGEYTPKNEKEYDEIAEKWGEQYGHIPGDPTAQPSSHPYNFWEAALGELLNRPKPILVKAGPKTTASGAIIRQDTSQ